MQPTRALTAGLLLAVTISACGIAAGPASTTPAPTPRPTPTDVPGGFGGGTGGLAPGGGGSGSGGGSDPGQGGGGTVPFPPGPGDDPLRGAATYVHPTQGLRNLHPVNVQLVRAAVNADGTVTADLRWWSGVAPCSQLGAVQVQQDDAARAVTLIVIEGAGPGDVACIDIAQLTATLVDLGALATGWWTISAEGDAPAITLDVP